MRDETGLGAIDELVVQFTVASCVDLILSVPSLPSSYRSGVVDLAAAMIGSISGGSLRDIRELLLTEPNVDEVYKRLQTMGILSD